MRPLRKSAIGDHRKSAVCPPREGGQTARTLSEDTVFFLGDYLLRNAAEYPDRIAVIQDERSLSYRELNTECSCLANSLREIGLSSGDRLAVLMRNSIEWLLLFYACQKLGVGVTLVHARLMPDEILRTIELAGADTLVYGPEFADKAAYIDAKATTLKNLILFGSGLNEPLPAGHYSFDRLLQGRNSAEAQIPLNESQAGVILFTSGTTSASKGIVRTQAMMSAYASLLADEESLRAHDTMLTPSPLYHAAGLCCVVKMLVNAGTLVLLSRFDSEKICREIERCGATQLTLVPPTSYRRLKASGFAGQYDLGSVKLIHITAGRAGKECLEDLFSMFPQATLRLTWGSTEASNVTVAFLTRRDLLERPELLGTVGKLNPLSELRLCAEDGSIVEGVGDGEAWVRSPLVFSGYINAPELSEKSFSDGWYKTEDILHRDAEGYYYLRDRKRDIIKTGGENVYALEIEQAILAHPAVSDCAVVGIPDARFGEAVAAALVLKDGCTLEAEDFIGFCRTVLPSFKKPKYWAVMEALPRNDIGKVCKTVLKADAAALFSPIA